MIRRTPTIAEGSRSVSASTLGTPTLADIDALVERAQRGEGAAFDRLVLALQQEVRIAVIAHAPDLDLAEEVVQATFVTAFERLATYRLEQTFPAWLKGIAMNLLRRELRQRAVAARRAGGPAALEALIHGDGSALATQSPEHEALLTRLRGCLGQLSPRARALIEDRYASDASLDALTSRWKLSEEALASALYRIRRVLRDCLHGREGTA